jgi:DNA-binding SARP family transcriptional activator
MAVTFGLLGEIEAHLDGRALDLGPARQRCVLAALLVDANRSVPVEQLMDRVWADRKPQRAREVLYSYLSRLRHALAGATDMNIGRQPAGYVLTVEPTAIDLHRFHRLLAQARAAGDDEDTADLLKQALGLWRGEAFATLDSPWINAIRDSLNRERWAAELDRNDLALRRGQHAALLAELAARSAMSPLDERLASQLILALYRCGRQADALSCYEEMRRRLATELGVDPSPPLQRLHHQILTVDPTLAAPPLVVERSGSAAGCSIPRQLPASPQSFTGRTHELDQLDAILDVAGRQPTAVIISAVSGTAGVGKTALAVHWAHRVADHFTDGQLYVNLRGFDPTGAVMDPAAAIRGFLDALAVPPQRIPADPDAQAALYRSLLAGRRMLVVLDNARTPDQVRPLLPGSPGCLVLVTSRDRLSGLVAANGAHPLTLDLLTPEEAWQLLDARLGTARVAAQPATVDDIISSCARLPLALAIVAARAAALPHFPLHALAAELHDARDRLDALADTDPSSDVRAVFSWSYLRLSDEAARLFRLLGLAPGPDISTAAAASLVGLPSHQVRLLLVELTRANLVNEHVPGRYAFHDLLRVYATERAHAHDSHIDRRTAIGRLLDHYLHTALSSARTESLSNPHSASITAAPPLAGVTPLDLADAGQAAAWFAAEHAVLLAAVSEAASTGFGIHVWQLAVTLTNFMNRRGYWHDQIVLQRAAIDAVPLADRPEQAHTRRRLGRAYDYLAIAYEHLGRYDDALVCLQEALDLFGDLGDLGDQAGAHIHLAWLSGMRGSRQAAMDHLRQAVNLHPPAGPPVGSADALNTACTRHPHLDEHQQIIVLCLKALALTQENGDRDSQARMWFGLGVSHDRLGHQAQAVACYEQALDLCRMVGDRYLEADTLTHLGDAHHAVGEHEAARAAWQHSLFILDQLDHPDVEEVRTRLEKHHS